MAVQPGQMFAQCRLVQQIGAGGMGVVWKALDTSLNRHVAIKILPASLTSDSEWRQRFQREAEAAAALDHPNIAVIHQVGEQDGIPFIVMQLLDGQTLRQVLREGPLPLKRWLRVASGMADGLAHAHGQGIIHRDLKPDNVMITTDRQVKILDFGLAKVLESGRHTDEPPLTGGPQSGDPNMTTVGRTFGTLSYMSPEQAGGEAVDQRSDIFSLGVLLYEMATGRVPFKGKSEDETRQAIISQEPPPLGEPGTALPPEAERVMRKALEKEPERRYQHSVEMATDLSNLERDLVSGRAQPAAAATAPGAAPGTGPAARSGTLRPWALAGAALVAVLALTALITGFPASWRQPTQPGTDAADAARTSAAVGAAAPGAATAAAGRQMIVVLPFENLGPPEDEYFAAGITEEITSRLAAVNGLGVISRKSALQYAGTAKSIKEIGQELGIGYVLAGTVRWARGAGGASRVRITPQLIRVSDDTHLWSGAYDEVINDIFQVQSDIAARVIEQTGVALLDSQRQALDYRPTENLEAYRAYVRGMDYFRRPDQTRANFQLQVDMFNRAVELDPAFALAYASMGVSHAGLYHFGHDRSDERRMLARKAVDRSLELAPELPQAHLALGVYHYWCNKDYTQALASFKVAQHGMPSSADLAEFVGFVQRRQGLWKEAAVALEASFALNPLDPRLAQEIGLTHEILRDYERALRYSNISIGLSPDQANSYLDQAETWWLWQGSLAQGRAALEAMPETELPLAVMRWFLQEIFEGKYQEAIDRLRRRPEAIYRHYSFVTPRSLLMAQAYDLMEDPGRARSAYDSAHALLQQELTTAPDDYRVHSGLGLALAGLGRRDEAMREGRQALELYPLAHDAVFGIFPIADLALIAAKVGDDEVALDQLKLLLSIPSVTSVAQLKLDPRLARLRQHPRFQALAQSAP